MLKIITIILSKKELKICIISIGVRKPIPGSFALPLVLTTLSDNLRLADIVFLEIACLGCFKGEISSTLVSIFLETRERKESDITFW